MIRYFLIYKFMEPRIPRLVDLVNKDAKKLSIVVTFHAIYLFLMNEIFR